MIRLWGAREPIHPKRLEEKTGMAGLSRTHDKIRQIILGE